MSKTGGNIILIGFMGSGKTTFGQWIAKTYGYDFCDTDQYIETQQQRKINDIFATDGEEAFRQMETETVRGMCSTLKHTVISVGGGLPVREENRKLLKELGTVVYLRTSEKTLLQRLRNDKNRPLLAGGDLKEKIRRLMAAREHLYLDGADVVIDTDQLAYRDMYAMIQGYGNESSEKKENI